MAGERHKLGDLADVSSYLLPEAGVSLRPMTEETFQGGIRSTPWFEEFRARYGEEPNLNDPNYNYRAAWAAGARPEVRDPTDQLLHWPSEFKGPNHPNRFVHGIDTITGEIVTMPIGALAAPDTYKLEK